jgi:hypothetical protein
MDFASEDRSQGSTPGYPRPQLQRSEWITLDGVWDFAIDRRGELLDPDEVQWDEKILVPFAPETALSGIGDTSFFCAVWYRRHFTTPELKPGERLILHFGAVDYAARVWVNGIEVCLHEGGYTPFSVEITAVLRAQDTQEIIVRAEDDPADLEKPRGKQDWKLEPHSIWYPRTTGIWQTVWMEVVPQVHIESVRWTSSLERWEIGLGVHVKGNLHEGCLLAVQMLTGDQVIVNDTYAFVGGSLGAGSIAAGELYRSISLSDPGIDDFRNDLLWSPKKPTIIDVEMTLLDASGATLDAVKSYTALRAITIQGDRFILNGRPLPLHLVLGRQRANRSQRRCVHPRHPAGESARLQRRPQAPENRRPAFSILGRPSWPAGVGGDAQRLPLYETFSGAANPGMDRSVEARLEPSLHHILGSVQRELGCPRSSRQSGAEALRSGAISPHENARPYAACHRQ